MNDNILQELDSWQHQYHKIQDHLEEKIAQLRTTIKNQNDTIHTLQTELKDLKNQENFKQKFDEAQDHLDKEKERLEKLYHKYWETENEAEKLRNELQKWHHWFDQNKDIFDKLFTGAPAQNQEKDKPKEPTKPQKNETKDTPPPRPIKTAESNRRRIRFRR